jgi:hypothetical protein
LFWGGKHHTKSPNLMQLIIAAILQM